MAQEKTEKATPKRRRDARLKEGNVLQSKEIPIAVTILGTFWILSLLAKMMYAVIIDSVVFFMELMNSVAPDEFDIDTMMQIFIKSLTVLFIVVGPILLASIILGVLPVVIQTKGLFTMKPLAPKFSKLNPFKGLKKFFSLQSVVNVLKSLLEIIIICVVVYFRIIDLTFTIKKLPNMEIIEGVIFTAESILGIVFTITIFISFIAAGDYVFQWWQYEKKLRMSKQEVKDEYKNVEGDPLIKSKIKQKQREMSQKRMMQDVPTSDIVVKNPTHYAVALKYEPHSKAPVVLAKGKDNVALKIISIAEENDVFIKEDRPLARSLYDLVKIGDMVPESLYMAVAVVLSEMFELKAITLDDKGNIVKKENTKGGF